MLSDELFLKAELNTKIGLKTSKKGPGAPVIDILFRISDLLHENRSRFGQKYFRYLYAIFPWKTYLKSNVTKFNKLVKLLACRFTHLFFFTKSPSQIKIIKDKFRPTKSRWLATSKSLKLRYCYQLSRFRQFWASNEICLRTIPARKQVFRLISKGEKL